MSAKNSSAKKKKKGAGKTKRSSASKKKASPAKKKKTASGKKAGRKAAKSTKKKVKKKVPSRTAKKAASTKKAKSTPKKSTPKKSTAKAATARTTKAAKSAAKKSAATAKSARTTEKTTESRGKRKSPHNKRKLERIRQFLVLKKRSLTEHLKSELSELETGDKHHLADLEEMASDTTDTDSTVGIIEVGTDTLEQIDRALQTLDDGTYGICEDCEETIPIERLEALPFATLCIHCKSKREATAPRW